jgi:hypothetical protein
MKNAFIVRECTELESRISVAPELRVPAIRSELTGGAAACDLVLFWLSTYIVECGEKP